MSARNSKAKPGKAANATGEGIALIGGVRPPLPPPQAKVTPTTAAKPAKPKKVTVISAAIDLLKTGKSISRDDFIKRVHDLAGAKGQLRTMTRVKLLYRVGVETGLIPPAK
jgi:hypothetical protein